MMDFITFSQVWHTSIVPIEPFVKINSSYHIQNYGMLQIVSGPFERPYLVGKSTWPGFEDVLHKRLHSIVMI